ncbi:MAG TPA: hypothetical protein VGD91_20035 [Trebonia sp.]
MRLRITGLPDAAAHTAEQLGTTLADVAAERCRQERRWGPQNHPDGTGPTPQRTLLRDQTRTHVNTAIDTGTRTWLKVLTEEVNEAACEDDPGLLRAELVQVAAVTVAWIEAIDRRSTSPSDRRMTAV